MEKYISSLEEASRKLKTADHMIYITFPLIKDNKLLLKILNELYKVMLNIVNAILQYEYAYKRVELSRDAKENLSLFVEKCAPRYNILHSEIESIMETFQLMQKHKQSPFEFSKDSKIVIMSDNAHTDTITVEKIKEFITCSKQLLKKAELRIKHRI